MIVSHFLVATVSTSGKLVKTGQSHVKYLQSLRPRKFLKYNASNSREVQSINCMDFFL